jgi:hypothetical protein
VDSKIPRELNPTYHSCLRPTPPGRVADRVKVHTAAMTAGVLRRSFDVVTSALAIHNIHSPTAATAPRTDEAMRVLRPGGQLLIANLSTVTSKYATSLK